MTQDMGLQDGTKLKPDLELTLNRENILKSLSSATLHEINNEFFITFQRSYHNGTKAQIHQILWMNMRAMRVFRKRTPSFIFIDFYKPDANEVWHSEHLKQFVWKYLSFTLNTSPLHFFYHQTSESCLHLAIKYLCIDWCGAVNTNILHIRSSVNSDEKLNYVILTVKNKQSQW